MQFYPLRLTNECALCPCYLVFCCLLLSSSFIVFTFCPLHLLPTSPFDCLCVLLSCTFIVFVFCCHVPFLSSSFVVSTFVVFVFCCCVPLLSSYFVVLIIFDILCLQFCLTFRLDIPSQSWEMAFIVP